MWDDEGSHELIDAGDVVEPLKAEPGVLVPGSPSHLRPRNPPSLAVSRMASCKVGGSPDMIGFLAQ